MRNDGPAGNLPGLYAYSRAMQEPAEIPAVQAADRRSVRFAATRRSSDDAGHVRSAIAKSATRRYSRGTRRDDENAYVGFPQREAGYADIVSRTTGKVLLNFDDAAYGTGLGQLLTERFPEPSPYESQVPDSAIGTRSSGSPNRGE